MAHAGFVVFMAVSTILEMFENEYAYEPKAATIASDEVFYGFIAINAIALLIPVVKLIWIFVEKDSPEPGYFRMDTD